MIWFRLKRLEEKIINDQLTDKDGFNYLFASVLYGFIYYFIFNSNGFNYLLIINTCSAILITIIGLPILFKINSVNDNKDFFKRYFGITWIVRLRLLIITLIYYGLILLLFDLRVSNIGMNIVSCVFSILINFLFYYLAAKSFKRLKIR